MWALSFALWSPARLVITIIICSQAAQVGAIGADDVNLAAVIIAILVKVCCEYHPLAIRRKGRTLAIASFWRQLARVRPISVHDEDLSVPCRAGIGDNRLSIRRP